MIKRRLGSLTFNIPDTPESGIELTGRYMRSERAFLASIGEMALKGVLTNKLKMFAEAYFGSPIPILSVVSLSKSLNDDLVNWRKRAFDKAYPYIVISTRYEKILVNKNVIDQDVIIVAGVDEKGKRRILDFTLEDIESEIVWRDLFNMLTKRGLHGVRLVVSKKHRGMEKAVKACFDGALWQQCQAHFIDEVFKRAGNTTATHDLTAIIKEVFDADDINEALANKKKLLERLKNESHDIFKWIDENIKSCLTVFNFPANHKKRLRTVNMLVSLLNEIRKRTRLIKIFPCRESAERLVGALVIDQDEEWMNRRKYLNMKELELIEVP